MGANGSASWDSVGQADKAAEHVHWWEQARRSLCGSAHPAAACVLSPVCAAATCRPPHSPAGRGTPGRSKMPGAAGVQAGAPSRAARAGAGHGRRAHRLPGAAQLPGLRPHVRALRQQQPQHAGAAARRVCRPGRRSCAAPRPPSAQLAAPHGLLGSRVCCRVPTARWRRAGGRYPGRIHPGEVRLARGRAAHPPVLHRGRPHRLGQCAPARKAPRRRPQRRPAAAQPRRRQRAPCRRAGGRSVGGATDGRRCAAQMSGRGRRPTWATRCAPLTSWPACWRTR